MSLARRMTPRLLVLVLAGGALGCGGETPPFYDGTVAEWQRDSALVESMARAVDTDPLYHAYHASLTDLDHQRAHQAIACAQVALLRRHGRYPALVAMERMKDTLWKSVDPGLIAAHDARMPPGIEVFTDDSTCGLPRPASGVDTLPAAVRLVDPRQRPGGLK